MLDDRLAALAGLRDDGDALLHRARFAAQASGEPRSDSTGSVTAVLDENGRVVAVTVASEWRSRLSDGQLGAAVVDAVREATVRREASQLTLSAHELSWASLPTGLLDTYAELQRKVVTLLEEASEVYDGLSSKLDKVAYQYETNDELAARQLQGVWEPRE